MSAATDRAPDGVMDEAPLRACDGPGAEAARQAGEDFDRLVALWQSLRGALLGVDRSIRAASGDRDLGLAHWLVLLRLGRYSPMPQSELRRQTSLDSGFLTRLLDDLAARRLLQRTRSGTDRRQVQLRITPQGRDAVRGMLIAAGATRQLEPLRRPEACRLQQLAASLFAESPHEPAPRLDRFATS